MRMKCRLCAVALFLSAAALCGAEELPAPMSMAGPNLSDVFDASQMAKARPGDWFEYRVAYPGDPLESRLSSPGDASAIQTMFDLPPEWRVVPVRIEIREVFPDGCNAEITFGDTGERATTRLSGTSDGAHASFQYDGGAATEQTVRIGGKEYIVQERRRSGSGYGFVRWTSVEIPFGVIRFATEHVDMQLVGMGRGSAPDFPLPPEDEVAPPLGSLY